MIIDSLISNDNAVRQTFTMRPEQLNFVKEVARRSNSNASAVVQFAIDRLKEQIGLEEQIGVDFDSLVKNGIEYHYSHKEMKKV